MPTGLVVAGGYSTRCGLAAKPLLAVRGRPMLCRVVAALAPVVDEVVIDCRTDQVAPFETVLSGSPGADPADESPPVRFAVDDEPDRGPVAGLATGLASVDAGETVVASCDRPALVPEVFWHLGRARRLRNVDAAVPALDGRLQPLCGVYETDALREAAVEAVATGERRLCRLADTLSRYVLPERALASIADPEVVRSVDTPLEARLVDPDAGRPDRHRSDASPGSVSPPEPSSGGRA